jgi:NTE family protein
VVTAPPGDGDAGGDAVVMGAGGAAGWAFHAGVVAGLAQLGRPLQQADVVVGTSAGAPVAAAVLAGASPEQVTETLLRPPTPAEVERYRATLADARSSWRRRLRPAAPHLAVEALPNRAGVGVALAGLVPSGLFPTTPLRRAPGVEDLGTDWPAGLWIPAVRLSDGQRVTFGRDRVEVAVADAVEASQAVPIMFMPRRIDDDRYVDGATRSPTNADVLVGAGRPVRGIGHVLLVAPMSRHPTWIMRTFANRRLRQELAMLVDAGLRVTVVVPDDEVAAHLDGFPRRDPAAIPEVVAGGRRAVIEALDP